MKNFTTVVNFILDETGSMGSIKNETISGFNEYINGLKKNKKGKILFTLTKFDSEGLRTPYLLTDIAKVEPLSEKTYQPGSMTPLYDAVVETVEKVADKIKVNEASLVIIMTDGEENASKKHNERCLRDLIEKLQGKGNWTFAFLGANQNSWATARNWGIPMGNISNWQATSQGTQDVFRSSTVANLNYVGTMASNISSGQALNTSNFFGKTTGGDQK